jgi:hypothetical protein
MNNSPRVFRAVQEDTAAFVMDWPIFGDKSSTSEDFGGQVFVLNGDGAAVGQARWSAPTDHAADAALASSGWTSRVPPSSSRVTEQVPTTSFAGRCRLGSPLRAVFSAMPISLSVTRRPPRRRRKS